jgi:nucleotide-binding universal stress UspA family protein
MRAGTSGRKACTAVPRRHLRREGISAKRARSTGTYPAWTRCMSTRRVAANVLVAAIDFSEIAPLVVRDAIEAARQMDAGQIHFVHVRSRPGSEQAGASQCERLGGWLETLLSTHAALPPGTQVLVHEISGEPASSIVALAETLRAACIIVGARTRNGGASAPLSSIAKAVVRDAACPVLVVRPPGAPHRASASTAPAFAP